MANIGMGSIWRKWDLHIHTPLSICQVYGGDQEAVWEKFITALENLPKEVSVIGHTTRLMIRKPFPAMVFADYYLSRFV